MSTQKKSLTSKMKPAKQSGVAGKAAANGKKLASSQHISASENIHFKLASNHNQTVV